ncbi:MAG: type II/IV secretion system protein [Myxococcales bacterium]|nr:type II/IV secretion system protein [Myxococcales bacterium]
MTKNGPPGGVESGAALLPTGRPSRPLPVLVQDGAPAGVDARGHAGPLSLDLLLEVLHGSGLLSAAQAHEVRIHAERRRRLIERNRTLEAGEEAAVVMPAELVASFALQTPQGTTLSEERIQQALAQATGLRYVRVDALKIDARLVVGSVSHAFARRNSVLPMAKEGGKLVVAVDDPFAKEVAVNLQARTELPVELVVAVRQDILRQIFEIFHFRATIRGAAADLGEGLHDIGNLEQLVRLGQAGEAVDGDDKNVVRAVDFLLGYALEQAASDIHVEPKRDKSLVRLRIDGVLHTVHELPKIVHHAITSRIKTLARLDIAEKRRPQDGRIKIQHKDIEVELRISTLPTAFGEKVVMRIFDPQVLLQDIASIGMFPNEYEQFRRFVARPHGLVLVCGPTGSGKTTTLYSALRAIAQPTLNITTIEDPIEMVVEAFNQTAVNPRIGLTFADALRHILRQDPDVVMVGEIRDQETAQNAIQAAMTGHLVLSTVHTNDAPSTIARLFDLGIEPFLVGSTLVGVVAQRLLRTVCMACRFETELNPDQMRVLGLDRRPGERFPVHAGAGCALCRDTGLKGRTGVFEVMAVTDKVRRLIVDRRPTDELQREAVAGGMLTLREAAIKKMALGLTTFGEVLRVTTDGEFR